MPYWKCTSCHHEFEGGGDKDNVPLCDWCGSPSYILEEKTPLELMCDDIRKVGIEKWLDKLKK